MAPPDPAPSPRAPVISMDPRWANVFAALAVALIALKVGIAIWVGAGHQMDQFQAVSKWCTIMSFAGANIIPIGQLAGFIGK